MKCKIFNEKLKYLMKEILTAKLSLGISKLPQIWVTPILVLLSCPRVLSQHPDPQGQWDGHNVTPREWVPAVLMCPLPGIWGLQRAGQVGRTGPARSPGPRSAVGDTWQVLLGHGDTWQVLPGWGCRGSRTDVAVLVSGLGFGRGSWGCQDPQHCSSQILDFSKFHQNSVNRAVLPGPGESHQISLNLTKF